METIQNIKEELNFLSTFDLQWVSRTKHFGF